MAVDVNENRLAVARALGVPLTVLATPESGAAELLDLLPDRADVVFETSGVTGAAARGFAVTAPGGTTVLVGLNKTPQPLNLADLVLREIDVRTTVAHVCDEDLEAALGLLAEKPLAPLLVDRVVPLSAVVTAGLEPLVAGAVSGKVLVDPRRG